MLRNFTHYYIKRCLVECRFLSIIGIAEQAISLILTHFSVVWSVRRSHSCTVLKPFDEFRCYFRVTFLGPRIVSQKKIWKSSDTLC